MYDELVKRMWECASGECFNCSQYTPTTNASVCQKELMKQAADAIEELTGFVQEAERDRDEYGERLDKANDAIEELSAFREHITDGHLYCMRDGVLYEAKVELPKGKVFQLPPIEFAGEE